MVSAPDDESPPSPYGPPPTSSYPLYPPPLHPPPPYPPPGYQPEPPPASGSGRVAAVVIAVVAALLVLAGAVVAAVVVATDEDAASSGGGEVERDLSAVRQFHDLDPTHVGPGQDVDYPQSPPVGGNHAPMWLECGVHDEELPEEYAVHDLEHGTVWLTYRADDLDAAEVERLAELLPDNGLLSPYDDQDAPVVITVWGRQLELTGVDDPRIPLFIAEYGDGSTAPEPFASCHGGLDPEDVDDLADDQPDDPADGPVA